MDILPEMGNARRYHRFETLQLTKRAPVCRY
jgi:hypothetical protein